MKTKLGIGYWLLVIFLLTASSTYAATYTVINNYGGCNPADPQYSGSLCGAINQANNTTPNQYDTITFSNATEIDIETQLPALTDNQGVRIDAEGKVVVINDNNNNCNNCYGLDIASTNNSIIGLTILRFDGSGYAGIRITSSNNLIDSCNVGITTTGASEGNYYGIFLTAAATNNIIQASVISGNTYYGVYIQGNYNKLYNNKIGTNAAGDAAVANPTGIYISGQYDEIGGVEATQGNVISGNTNYGILITTSSATNNKIYNNHIGLNVVGNGAIANGIGIGITNGAANNTIGGSAANQRNFIAGNANYNIEINNASNNTIKGNFIGTNKDGTAKPQGATQNVGIRIYNGATNNTIGGTAAGERNIISGNDGIDGHGVWISSSGTVGNQIIGNYIGLNASGDAQIANNYGVYIQNGAANNTIDSNVISYNNNTGIVINGAGTSSNIVRGNKIGTNPDGTLDYGNGVDGIWILNGASNNIIGGDTQPSNIISGNNSYGVYLTDAATTGNTIKGNYIGLNAPGTSNLPNGSDGVRVLSSPNNTIENNVISGNIENGISISSANNNLILGNKIGTTSDGGNAIPNQIGIDITNAQYSTIGGELSTQINLISGNSLYGIRLNNADNTLIINNYIGTDAAGTSPLTNQIGIYLTGGSDNNTIGGNTATKRNIISGNTAGPGYGIEIEASNNNKIIGNYIGIKVDATAALPNTTGIYITGSSANNIIGGDITTEANVISGNIQRGIHLTTLNTQSNKIYGNYIGMDNTGNNAIPNNVGILIDNTSHDNEIGSLSTSSYRNIISGNTTQGIHLNDGDSNIIAKNYIGLKADGLTALRNGCDGILIENGGSSNNIYDNRIAYNSTSTYFDGIRIAGATSGNNRISQNKIYNNTGLGINLTGGANNNIATPIISEVLYQGNDTYKITGTASAGSRIELYRCDDTTAAIFQDPSGFGEGYQYLAYTTSNAAGNFEFTSVTITGGQWITVLSIELDNDTSEFAQNKQLIKAFVVTNNYGGCDNTNPQYNGSLCWAINKANTSTGSDTIKFNISNTQINIDGSWSASSTSTINDLSGGTTIDAVGKNIRVDGATCGSNCSGFVITSANNIIKGLDITGFNDTGESAIRITGPAATNNTIYDCGIGIVSTTNTAAGNYYGILIENSAANNTIGPWTAGEENTISANTYGIYITGSTTASNIIKGNYIGTRADGEGPAPGLGNTYGIYITAGANNNIIGGSISTQRNIIANNTSAGIYIGDTSIATTNNTIKGNYIGLDINGAQLANQTGVELANYAQNNTIGGDITTVRNIISGNTNYGIYLTGANCSGNTIKGNYIGTDTAGSAAIANTYGIYLTDNANNNKIGESGYRNIISGNTTGIYITGADNNTIISNYIGTDVAGTSAVGNTTGIYITDGSDNNIIGGTASGERNIITCNTNYGIYIGGTSASTNNTIKGNYIGLDKNGASLGNGNVRAGIYFGSYAQNNTIGPANVISGNNAIVPDGVGIYITTDSATGNKVIGNYIGTNITGTSPASNRIGIYLDDNTNNNTIGGEVAAERNIISGNTYAGIELNNNANNNSIINNYIGTDINGTSRIDNGYGILATGGASNNIIGGDTVTKRNVISGNTKSGIFISNASNNNQIINNYIGVDKNATVGLPNEYGVYIETGSYRNVIRNNIIAYNNTHGVCIDGDTTDYNKISQNRIYNNAGLGIKLLNNGNDNLSPPTIISVTYVSGNDFKVTGNAIAGATIEVYRVDDIASGIGQDPSLSGEGYQYLGSTNADIAGNFSIIVTVSGGNYVTAAQTDTNENTSEFASNKKAEVEFVVSNNYGGCDTAHPNYVNSLCWAITETNARSGVDTIKFTIATDTIIDISTELPAINDTAGGTTIDTKNKNIVINGSWCTNCNGFIIKSANNIIKGFTIINFATAAGIKIDGPSAYNNKIEQNYIGTDKNSTSGLGNKWGIYITNGAYDNTIGGVSTNFISGNKAYGVYISGTGTNNNKVINNLIGTNVTGISALPNGDESKEAGIFITNGASNNIIGSEIESEKNIISGHYSDTVTLYGIIISSSGTSNNQIIGNYIGIRVDGAGALRNNTGILIENSASNNIIKKNIISGNIRGIEVKDTNTTGNKIKGNYIGTKPDGSIALANEQYGIYIHTAASYTTIEEVNIISGNTNASNDAKGIYIYNATNNTISGNYIGLAKDGTTVLKNNYGIYIASAVNNIIGGITDATRNIISGNDYGIYIKDSSATNNTIKGNYIGVDLNGTAEKPNNYGIYLTDNTKNNIIGGGTSQERNIISGNIASAIYISNSANNNQIMGNYIGLDKDGNKLSNNIGIHITSSAYENKVTNTNVISGNNTYGIWISNANNNQISGNYIGTNTTATSSIANNHGVYIDGGSKNNLIGGAAAAQRNIISGNINYGVYIGGDTTQNNKVTNNYIGLNATGGGSIPNKYGIYIDTAADNNIIGGDISIERNVISGNTNYGICVTGADTTKNIIRGNYIGTQADGSSALPNQSGGIYLSGNSYDNTIGGVSTVYRNIISGNFASGIRLENTINNKIIGNYIGISYDGAVASPNTYGIYIAAGAQNNTIGSTSADEANVISGNKEAGIVIENTQNNQIYGNLIGLNKVGATAIANKYGMVLYNGANNNTIGGATKEFANFISGNTQAGIRIYNSATNTNIIKNNYIGTNKAVSSAVANNYGIELSDETTNNTIEANIICGNTTAGVIIKDLGTNTNILKSNYIGITENDTIIANTTGVIIDNKAQSNTIDTNIISGNTTYGIRITSSGTMLNVIKNNYIGTNKDGNSPKANKIGILIDNGAATNEISKNTISGNTDYGIQIKDAETNGNKVSGNKIGTDKNGTSKLANNYGIYISGGAYDNTIGGLTTNTDERNIISGNTYDGIYITSSTNNKVYGNYIGVDVTGAVKVANTSDGIELTSAAHSNIIGDTNKYNIISGNSSAGIRINNSNSNEIKENYIGLDYTGKVAIANNYGIYIENGSQVTTIDNNIISGNTELGICITGSNNNTITNNYIGLDKDGTVAIGNKYGVYIKAAASSNNIGPGNKISGNTEYGILITDSTTSDNKINGNYIGLDKNGTTQLANASAGIYITDAKNNEIGVSARNIIAGHSTGMGIALINSNNNQIKNNYIGIDKDATTAIKNKYGIYLYNITVGNNLIGGATSTEQNIISGNEYGIYIYNADNNKIEGNLIGVNTNSYIAIPNEYGIYIRDGSNNNTIGGDVTKRNIISGNNKDGIYITSGSSSSTDNLIDNNYIGLATDGTTASPNKGNGIIITKTGKNTISNNRIQYNDLAGIYLSATDKSYTGLTTDNEIKTNIISNNKAQGIYCEGSSPIIDSNTVTYSTLDGILNVVYFGADATSATSSDDIKSKPTIINNTIQNSGTNISIHYIDIPYDSADLYLATNNNTLGDTTRVKYDYYGWVKVLDKNNNPVNAAAITIKDKNGATVKTATTGIYGYSPAQNYPDRVEVDNITSPQRAFLITAYEYTTLGLVTYNPFEVTAEFSSNKLIQTFTYDANSADLDSNDTASPDGRFQIATLGPDRPDLLIKNYNTAAYDTGDGIYNTDGTNQLIDGGCGIYHIKLQNDDTKPDNITLTATAAAPVKYYDSETIGQGLDITATITSPSGYSVNLNPGQEKIIRAEVSGVVAATEIWIRATSGGDTKKVDYVKAKTNPVTKYKLSASQNYLLKDAETTITIDAVDVNLTTIINYNNSNVIELTAEGGELKWRGYDTFPPTPSTYTTIPVNSFKMGQIKFYVTSSQANKIKIKATQQTTTITGDVTVEWVDVPPPPAAVYDAPIEENILIKGEDTEFTQFNNTLSASWEKVPQATKYHFKIYHLKGNCIDDLCGETDDNEVPVVSSTIVVKNATHFLYDSTEFEYDTWLYVTATNLNLLDGATYYFKVKSEIALGAQSSWAYSNGQRVDTTPPVVTKVEDEGDYTASTNKLEAAWEAKDDQSGVIEYKYAIGTSPGGIDVADWTLTTATFVKKEGLTLENGKTYYFSVKAKNKAGAWSPDAKYSNGITVDTTPPSSVTYIYDGTAADISSTNSNNTLSANWGPGYDEESGIKTYWYRILEMGGTCIDDAQAGCNETDDIEIISWTNNSAQRTVTHTGLSLSENKIYYFQVQAQNGAGSYGPIKHSDGVGTDFTKPVIADIEVIEKTYYTVKIKFTTDEETKPTILYGKTTSYDKSVLKMEFATSHTLQILGLEKNTTYHYQVVAEDKAGNKTSSTNYTFRTYDRVSLTIHPNTLTMFSLPTKPLAADPEDAKLFGKDYFKNIAKWSPQNRNYDYYKDLLTHAKTGKIKIEPAQGYWIRRTDKDPSTVYIMGEAIEQDYYIPLYQGWNQIGMPFTTSRLWKDLKVRYKRADVKSIRDAAAAHWVVYGAFYYPSEREGFKIVHPELPAASRTIDPTLGYFVYALQDECELIIPYSVYSPKMREEQEKDIPWSMQLTAQVGNKKDSANFIGKSKFNQILPEPEEVLTDEYVSLYFVNGDSKLSVDLRKEPAGEYEFEVATNIKNKEVILTWDYETLPDDYSITLIDLQNNTTINMKEVKVYKYDNTTSIAKFRIKVVKLKTSNEITKLINFPNPFKDKTTIRIEAGNSVHYIKVNIYNIAGGKVDTIEEYSPQNLGNYTYHIRWQPRGVANGVYLYQVKVRFTDGSEAKRIGKMVILR